MQGFAEHDWAGLARPGAVAAVYMGKTSARFMQGRLMMHGAAADTPVTVVENASRGHQQIHATDLARMARTMAEVTGPALTFIGLSPRDAMVAAEGLESQEIAL